MDFSTVKEPVLFGLAIYAAGLSTWNLVQAIRRDRRNLGVKVSSVIPIFSNGPPGRVWAQIAVTNLGSRNVTVSSLAFELDDGKQLLSAQKDSGREGLEETPLPCTLRDGETANLYRSYYSIGHALVTHGLKGKTRITPVCKDSAGGVHKGEVWVIESPIEMVLN
jgi:hypothetical protein